ncbi:ATP-binding protein [Phytohabitans houttuyneae]|uniref:Helicase HerA central domain-containing protein n=1 Tax=Phytohabitans houttuyneae TaxID=1076126 RepID=A0A6V8KAJ7_9ACTN|nr:DUF87 domain-containing protein [Phytohabitans houttuyneae]GFJ79408.1 hypothetical protein Phou_035880 [Phytohabitans houttuyneae]
MQTPGLAIADNLTLPIEAVVETFAILAKRGAGKTFTASVMVEEMVATGQPVCVIDPVGVWFGLRSSADGEGPGLPVVIFGGDHADLPLPADAGAAIADLIIGERIPAVLDLSHLSKTKGRKLVCDFMERLYFRNRNPLHLVVDEADLFAPQRGGADTARLVGAYEDIVRRGRARGLGCTSITQRPASLHKDILTQSEVLIALRMTGVRDVAAINEWVNLHAEEGEAAKVRDSLASLPVGTAWVWSPGWLGVLKKIQVRRRWTFDSSATPKPGQIVVPPRVLADVDLDDLRKRLAEPAPTADRQTDTAEVARLRGEVATLRAELETVRAEVRTVEVPALSLDDHVRLAEALRTLTAAMEPIAAVVSRPAPVRTEPLPRAAPTPIAAPPASPARPVKAATVASGPQEAKLGRAERAILTVLAQHPAGRTRVQLALLTGYSVKSSSLSNALGTLRSQGLVTKGGEPIQATDAGLNAATDFHDFEALPTGQALYEVWAGRLGKAERAVLDVLVAAWPEALPRDEVAARTGYSASSSSLSNALGRLRSLDLIAGWAASNEFMEAIQ